MIKSLTNRGKIGSATLVFGAAIVLSAGYGLMVVRAVPPEIWALNGNVVSTFPTTRAVTLGGALTQGGGVTASSTSASVTLAGTELDTENVLDYTVNVGSPTLTLPASTSSMYPTTAGQMRTVWIRHATTTAASNLTIAGGTGVLLKKAATSTGATIYGDTDGGSHARIDLLRKANTDVEAFLTVFND